MSSLTGKDIGIMAGVAVTSFLAGGIIGKLMNTNEVAETTGTSNLKKSRLCDQYISDNSLREPAVLKELREHTVSNVQLSQMLTDPIESQFFRLLLNTLDAKKCIEVGTYTGYNALSCALTIPADGIVYALDVNEAFVKEGYPFFENAGVKDKIKVKIGPAVESLDELIADGQGETFDFVYIDADKAGYESYLDRALLLLRVGGIVALDNTLQGGRVLDPSQCEDVRRRNDAEIMKKLNKKIMLDNRFQLSFLNIADGVTLCRKI